MKRQWRVLLPGAALVVSQAHLAWMLHTLTPSVIALQLSFDVDTFWRILAAWGEPGQAAYRAHFVFDTLHPFIYGAFGIAVARETTLFAHLGSAFRRVLDTALPVAATFDLAENALHLRLLAHPPGFADGLVPLAALCSSIKWGLVCPFAAMFAWQCGRRLWHATASRRRPSPCGKPTT